MVCPYCGFVIERESRKPIAEKEGELQELTPEELERRRKTKERHAPIARARTREQLLSIAQERNYGNGDAQAQERWVNYIVQARARKGIHTPIDRSGTIKSWKGEPEDSPTVLA